MPRLLRGATPTPRHLLAAAFPHEAAGETPPQFIYLPKHLDMWGNATFGCCVTAEEAFAKSCHDPEFFIPAHKVIKWARKNGTLNGANLWNVMNLMQAGGFDQDFVTYNDGPFKSVDWQNDAVLQNAIAQGPVKIGVASDELDPGIPNIGVTNGWIATGLTPGNPQDHCTSLCGYGSFGWLAEQLKVTLPGDIEADTPGYAMFTWSTIGMIDVPSLHAICGEAWIRTPTTVTKQDQ